MSEESEGKAIVTGLVVGFIIGAGLILWIASSYTVPSSSVVECGCATWDVESNGDTTFRWLCEETEVREDKELSE